MGGRRILPPLFFLIHIFKWGGGAPEECDFVEANLKILSQSIFVFLYMYSTNINLK